MDTRGRFGLAAGLVVASVAASLALLPELPAEMATHWNAAGEVDGTMPRLAGALAIPALTAGLVVTFAVLPRIDPRGENFGAFRPYYDWFVVVFAAFMAYVHGLVLAVNLGYDVSVGRMLLPSVGLLYVYVGVLLRRAEPNWFVGIRTPWTLESDVVWRDTHDLAARLFVLAGPLALLGALLPAYAEVLVAAPAFAIALVTTAYSYWRYGQVGGDGDDGSDVEAGT